MWTTKKREAENAKGKERVRKIKTINSNWKLRENETKRVNPNNNNYSYYKFSETVD